MDVNKIKELNNIIQDWLDENASDWHISSGSMDPNTGQMMIILRDRRMEGL